MSPAAKGVRHAHDGTASGPFEAYNAQWQENAVPFVHPLDVPKAGMAAIVVAAMETMQA